MTKCINGYRKKVDVIEATLVTNFIYHTGKCKSTGGYYKELVLA